MRDIRKFKNKTGPQKNKRIQEKKNVLKCLYKFFESTEKVLDGFDIKIFSIKSKGSCLLSTDRSKLNILIPKQILEILLIALAQVKAGNNSKNVLNEIRPIVYFLYQ